MNADRAVEVAAAALTEHRFFDDGAPDRHWSCMCGARAGDGAATTDGLWAEHAAVQVLAALRAAVDPGDVDQLAEVARAAIEREAATWEVEFAAGSGMCVGVPDAAHVAARAVLAHLAPRLTGTGDEGAKRSTFDAEVEVAEFLREHKYWPSGPGRGGCTADGCAWTSSNSYQELRIDEHFDHRAELMSAAGLLAAGPVPVAGGDEAAIARVMATSDRWDWDEMTTAHRETYLDAVRAVDEARAALRAGGEA